MNKSEIRDEIKSKRKSLEPAESGRISRAVCRKISSLGVWKKAKTAAVYIPLPGEVDIWPLINEGLSTGKIILAPFILPETGKALFSRFHDKKELKPGPFGLLQPEGGEIHSRDVIDVIIVPGLAFSPDGSRIGFGKGYYDRILDGFRGESIAPAFEFQMYDDLPVSSHDIPVDYVVNERIVYICRKFK